MSLKFKPEDFEYDDGYLKFFHAGRIKAAELAQAKFDAWLKKQPVVNGKTTTDNEHFYASPEETLGFISKVTHQSRLVDIQLIEKAECEHEPIFICDGMDSSGPLNGRYECKRCGIKLKAKWEPING